MPQTIEAPPVAERKVNAPMMMRAAETRPSSYREDDNSVEVCWSTGAAVTRFDWWNGEYYTEELSMDPKAVRLERLNSGAAALDTHGQYRLADVVGSIEPGSARLENGMGMARVRLADTEDVRDTVAKIRAGHIRNISVGYIVHSYTRIEKDGERPVMRADDWEPVEISFVPVPADGGAQVRSHDAAQGGFPCIIRGLAAPSQQEIDMPQVTPGAPAGEPVERANPPAPAPVADQPAQVQGVSARRIQEVVARTDLGADFALELISRNEDKPMSEADLTDAMSIAVEQKRNTKPIDARRPNRVGPAGTESEGYRNAVSTAVMLEANPTVRVDDDAAQAAREFRGLSLLELARDFLQRTGISTGGMGKLEIAGAALGLRFGAMGTTDFAHALSDAASKRIRDAYTAAPQTFGPIVSRGTLPDFKPTNIVGLGDAPQLLLVAENAEFKYGAISDTGLSYALSTYGRIIAITRQAIINDDKNLFGRIPTMFGRKAADLESDIVWGIFTSNPTMGDGTALFHADHGNLAAAGSAITVASVGAGEQAMLQQKSVEGGFLTIRPEYMIVGPEKKVEAEQFLTAVAAAKTTDVNPYPGSLQLIVEPRITGKQWFLSASPSAFDTVEMAHLDGQEQLYIETQPGFDVDGVKTKARLDVGAAPIDWRGLYKNPGA